MNKSLNIFSLSCLLLAFSGTVYSVRSEELGGRQIVKNSDDLMRGDTSSGRYIMTVTTPGWTRRLKLDAWSAERDKTFIRILSPAKEEGIGTLRIKENMWNYLPKVERTIKIPPSMMLQPWMGSDFANDDLVKESSIVYDYTHNILAEENINGEMSYKIELIPKPQAPVTWGKIIFWIRKGDFVPLREEFYKEGGKFIKVLEYSQVKRMSDRSIPTIWKMTSMVKEGHFTVIEVVDAVYNRPIDENIFSLANLKRLE